MNRLDWPALAGWHPIPVALHVEHAIWGKVHGQKSDFRWIARSSGFVGHSRQLETALRIGRENRPTSMPLWRFVDGRYYAAWCYLSPASDASTRSNFLEKNILEWDPKLHPSIPPAAAAFVLLLEASRFNSEMWFPHHADPLWQNVAHFIGIPSLNVRLSGDAVSAAIADGCHFWAEQPPDRVAEFFSGVERGNKPAFISVMEQALPPVALASLLLPLPRTTADSLSLAGWLPADALDDGGGGRWDAVVSASRTAEPHPYSITSRLKAESLRFSDPDIAAGPKPWVSRLLQFAESRDRWVEILELPEGKHFPSAVERHYLQEALQKARNAATNDGDVPAALSDARRRHLELKADVIEAACNVLFDLQCTGPRVDEIIAQWKKDSPNRQWKG